jgi:two-component system chemotaxis response regulator CheY
MKKVQLVDDSPIIRKLAQRILEKEGLYVEANENTNEFLARFTEFKPDLCLIDINIDKIGDGLLLIKAIRNKIGNSIPIIVISSHEDNKDITKALDAGANDYICKPIDNSILTSKVTSYLDSKSSKALPVFSLSSNINPIIKIKRDIKIKTITEYGIVFDTHDFYYQNSYITLRGGILKELNLNRDLLRLKIVSTEVPKGEELKTVFAQFQEDDEELLDIVRDFIAK